MRTPALLLCVLLVASACGSGPRPLALPQRLEPVAVDSYLVVSMRIYNGARAPIPVTEIDARCDDRLICETAIAPMDRYRELRVIGRGAGSTIVRVGWVDPVTGQREHGQMAVTFTPAPRRSALELGKPVPATASIVHRQAIGLEPVIAPIGVCAPGSHHRAQIAGSDRSDVALFECSAAEQVLPGTARFRVCSGSCTVPQDSRYTACAVTDDGVVLRLSVLQEDRKERGSVLEEKLYEGPSRSSDATCRPL